MNYDPIERRPALQEIHDALHDPGHDDDDTDLPRVIFPYHSEQGADYEATLYFQPESDRDEDRAASDKRWMLAAIVNILRTCSLGNLDVRTLVYDDISKSTWQPPYPLKTLIIETVATYLEMKKDSTIEYGWKLNLKPNTRHESSTIQIVRLRTQYVIIFENTSLL